MSGSTADSNVVLYLAGSDPAKAAKARQIVTPGIPLSVQVLNEVANVFVRKWQRSWSQTEEFLDLVKGLAIVQPLDERTHELGISVARRHRLNVYDGMIIASALGAGCDTLYSEDMHHGLVVSERLRIVNPFRGD